MAKKSPLKDAILKTGKFGKEAGEKATLPGAGVRAGLKAAKVIKKDLK